MYLGSKTRSSSIATEGAEEGEPLGAKEGAIVGTEVCIGLSVLLEILPKMNANAIQQTATTRPPNILQGFLLCCNFSCRRTSKRTTSLASVLVPRSSSSTACATVRFKWFSSGGREMVLSGAASRFGGFSAGARKWWYWGLREALEAELRDWC